MMIVSILAKKSNVVHPLPDSTTPKTNLPPMNLGQFDAINMNECNDRNEHDKSTRADQNDPTEASFKLKRKNLLKYMCIGLAVASIAVLGGLTLGLNLFLK